eukprot:GILK01006809.1.p1 GENE.GILK01006809.1~~GILK01006809.1.p1  ORF type:complete len:1618 (-),score=349.73 GILK01006809.1:108-4961(-)
MDQSANLLSPTHTTSQYLVKQSTVPDVVEDRKRRGMFYNGELYNGAKLALTHAYGVQPELMQDHVVFVNEECFAFPVGRHLSVYDFMKKRMSFIPREAHVSRVTAMKLAPSGKAIAVAERTTEDKPPQVCMVHINSQQRWRTLVLTQASCDITSIAFSSDGKFAATMTAYPESMLALWKWELEKLIAFIELKTPITRIAINPRHYTQISLCGPNYLRIWEYNNQEKALRESVALLPMRVEREECFVDLAWITSSGTLVVLTEKGPIYLFEANELRYTLDVRKPNTNSSAYGLVHPLTIPSVRACSLAAYSRGFVVGCSGGYICVYESDDKGTVGSVGFFKIENADLVRTISVAPDETNAAIITSTNVPPTGQRLDMFTFSLGSVDSGAATQDAGSNVLARRKDVDIFSPVYVKGVHFSPITGIDVAVNRKVVVSCGTDRTIRVWAWGETWKAEVKQTVMDDPACVTVHPMGIQLAVALRDRVRLYYILMDDLKATKDILLKGCRDAKYSYGGNMLALGAGLTVFVVQSYTGQNLHSFTGHIAPVRQICWSADDSIVLSAGTDGCVYAWKTAGGQRVAEYVAKGCDFHGLQYDEESHQIIICGSDQKLKVLEQGGTVLVTEQLVSDCTYTALCLSKLHNALFVGTSKGSVRVYLWPLDFTEYAEFPIHIAPITSIKMASDGSVLFTASADGSLFALEITGVANGEEFSLAVIDESKQNAQNISFNSSVNRDVSISGGPVMAAAGAASGKYSVAMTSLDDVYIVMRSLWDERTNRITELEDVLETTRQETEYVVHSRDLAAKEEFRALQEEGKQLLELERTRYNSLMDKFTHSKHDHELVLDELEIVHRREVAQLSDEFEDKLSAEMIRYDELCEDSERMRQKYEKQLADIVHVHENAIRALQDDFNTKYRTLETTHRQMLEDMRLDGRKFEEALDQQEGEYEKELAKVTETLQAKIESEKSKTDTAKKEVIEQKQEVKLLKTKVTELLNKLRQLEGTCQSYKDKLSDAQLQMMKMDSQIDERDRVIAEKENNIKDLREATAHLENYRFVLDHKVRELQKERDPLETQVGTLQEHVRQMYTELLDEFGNKKQIQHDASAKDQKMEGLQSEIRILKNDLRVRDTKYNRVLEDIADLARNIIPQSDWPEFIGSMFREYVQGKKVPSRKKRTFVTDTTSSANTSVSSAMDTTNNSQSMKDRKSAYNNGGTQAAVSNGHGNGSQAGADSAGGNESVLANQKSASADAAKERELLRQREMLHRQFAILNKYNSTSDAKKKEDFSRGQAESAWLLTECNQLRMEKRSLSNKLASVQRELGSLKNLAEKYGWNFDRGVVALSHDTPFQSYKRSKPSKNSSNHISSNELYRVKSKNRNETNQYMKTSASMPQLRAEDMGLQDVLHTFSANQNRIDDETREMANLQMQLQEFLRDNKDVTIITEAGEDSQIDVSNVQYHPRSGSGKSRGTMSSGDDGPVEYVYRSDKQPGQNSVSETSFSSDPDVTIETEQRENRPHSGIVELRTPIKKGFYDESADSDHMMSHDSISTKQLSHDYSQVSLDAPTPVPYRYNANGSTVLSENASTPSMQSSVDDDDADRKGKKKKKLFPAVNVRSTPPRMPVGKTGSR